MVRVSPRRGVLALGLVAMLAPAAQAQRPDPTAVPGELVVRYTAAADAEDRGTARQDAEVQVVRSLAIARTQLLEVEPGQSVSEAVQALEASGDVLFAEPNWIYRATATTPGDPGFGQLWGLHNTAQSVLGTAGTVDSDIDAPEAWDITTGSAAVTVAVVDTGVAYDHPDLAANIWSNSDETGGDGDDDDGNGRVDDVRGWDFVDDDNDPRDLNDHGTHVAGTIAAVGNNGVGVTGVSWSARIMPLRVLDAGGSGSNADIANAFAYAAQNGAQVVNASLGGPGQSALIDAAISAHPNTLYVVAAGNDGHDNDSNVDYPCNAPYANVLCVAATNQTDGLASFSNFGHTMVDLGAPGTNIRSTLPDLLSVTDVDSFEGTLADKWVLGGSGGSFTATSNPSTPYSTSQNWTVTPWDGSKLLDDNPVVAGYESNEDYWIRTKDKVGVGGAADCVLEYSLRHDLDVAKDHLYVETSTDLGTWTVRDTFTGWSGGWTETDTSLGTGLQVYVRFRIDADLDIGAFAPYDGVQLDDVDVRCMGSSYDATSYGNFSGTSMATPHVAGAAALLAGYRPDATTAQLRAWLLDTGDPLSELSGKTVTGRRLNARAALAAADAPVAVTGPATDVTQTTAVLAGSVDANGVATDYLFEWGTTTAYGSTTQLAAGGSGVDAVAVSRTLTGLSPGTTYHYRLVAQRGGVEAATGADGTFTTQAGSSSGAGSGGGGTSAGGGSGGESGPASALPQATTPSTPPALPATTNADGASTAPELSLPGQTRKGSALAAVSCATACTVSARLAASPRLARRLGLVARTVGSHTQALPAGHSRVRVSVRRGVLRAIRRLGLEELRLRLVLTVTDADGRQATLERRPTIPVG